MLNMKKLKFKESEDDFYYSSLLLTLKIAYTSYLNKYINIKSFERLLQELEDKSNQGKSDINLKD